MKSTILYDISPNKSYATVKRTTLQRNEMVLLISSIAKVGLKEDTSTQIVAKEITHTKDTRKNGQRQSKPISERLTALCQKLTWHMEFGQKGFTKKETYFLQRVSQSSICSLLVTEKS